MINQRTPSYFLLTLLLVFATLYSYPNRGGLGLSMPFNIAEWCIAVIFIAYTGIISLQKKTICYHSLFLYCLLFPLIICIESLFTAVVLPNVWLFRLLYIIGGLLFIAALLQFKLTIKQVEFLLYLIVLAMATHTLIGFFQITDTPFVFGIPRVGLGNRPIGIFQQPNLLATYLVTGVMIILFLISRPSFLARNIVIKTLMIVVFGAAIYIILAAGSRIGLLSLLLSIPIMLLSRWKQLFVQKSILATLVIAGGIAVYASTILASDNEDFGLNTTLGKVEHLSENQYQTLREGMYKIGINVIKQKPLLGHGMASFPKVWTEGKAAFIAGHPDAAVSPLGTGHPHNEILLWLIEGGIVAGLGLFIVFIAISRGIYLCGFSRGGAYLALLLPISLHTQTALPFYGSAVHWFLWLFIVFMIFRHQTKTISYNISPFLCSFFQMLIIIITLASLYFLWHTQKAHDELDKYMNGEKADMGIVLKNPYFNRFAEKVLMQSLLYSSIENNNKAPIIKSGFINWAEGRLAINAEPGMFIMLNDSYGFLDDIKNQCRIAKKGIGVYPDNARLQKTVDRCQ